MQEEAKKAQREYYRNYRATHKEQIRENNRRYWQRRAEKLREEEAKKSETACN